MIKHIIKLISLMFLPLMVLSLILYFSGIRKIEFDATFYSLFKSISINTIDIKIPSIPLIPSPEITDGFLAFVKFIVQVLNFIVNILNVVVNLFNIVIRVLMFIFNFMTAFVVWLSTIPRPAP